jgi:hypothetical protein
LADVTTLIAAIATTRAVANSLGPIQQAAVSLVANTAEATIPVDRQIRFWLVTYAFRSSGQWRPGMQRCENLVDANNAVAMFGRNPDYAQINVVGPINQIIPAST